MVENPIQRQTTTVFIFFCEKENEPKEIAPCYVTRQRALAGAPVLLASVGVCETRPPEERWRPQTVTASIPTDPVMLGT